MPSLRFIQKSSYIARLENILFCSILLYSHFLLYKLKININLKLVMLMKNSTKLKTRQQKKIIIKNKNSNEKIIKFKQYQYFKNDKNILNKNRINKIKNVKIKIN